MIVGLDQGLDKVQRNADVLVACIREVDRAHEEPLVVGGMSMGGLISRYALADDGGPAASATGPRPS